MTNFIPIPTIVGAYQKEDFDTQFSSFGPHVQTKWIHHEKQLEKVVEGDYDSITPVTAEFIPALDCCFRCPTCSYKKWKENRGIWGERKTRPESNLDRDPMRFYLDRLKEGGIKAVVFTGGGEPFYNPHTTTGIEYACETGLDVGIYTNGALLNEKIILRIFNAAPIFLRISLNAGNAESHLKIHGYSQDKKYFETVLRNIGLAAKERVKHDNKTNFGVSVIINPTNVTELEQIAQTLTEINESVGGGIGYLNVRPTLAYHGGKQFEEKIFKKAEQKCEESIRKILDSSGIQLYNLTYKFDDVMKPRPYYNCRASSFFVELGPDGTMYLCCEKLGYPEYEIGNLKEQTLENIWKSKKRKKVIEMVNNKKCKNCPPSCKPHQLNKIFDQIEDFRRCGRMDIVRDWIEDLKKMKLKDTTFL